MLPVRAEVQGAQVIPLTDITMVELDGSEWTMPTRHPHVKRVLMDVPDKSRATAHNFGDLTYKFIPTTKGVVYERAEDGRFHRQETPTP